MPDNLNLRRPHDAARINMGEEWEVRYWTTKWGVTPAQLQAAVNAVGVSSTAVARHLGKTL